MCSQCTEDGFWTERRIVCVCVFGGGGEEEKGVWKGEGGCGMQESRAEAKELLGDKCHCFVSANALTI